MPFDDEPRTNHAYVALKAFERGLIPEQEARRLLNLVYPEFAAEKRHHRDGAFTIQNVGTDENPKFWVQCDITYANSEVMELMFEASKYPAGAEARAL